MNVGQAEVAARVAVRQLRVVEPHDVQDRGVQVVDVDGMLRDLITIVVGTPVAEPPAHPAAGEEAGEAVVMVGAAAPEAWPRNARRWIGAFGMLSVLSISP